MEMHFKQICVCVFVLYVCMNVICVDFIFVSRSYSLLRRNVMWLVGKQSEVDVVATKYLCHQVIDMLMVVVYFDDTLVLYFECFF